MVSWEQFPSESLGDLPQATRHERGWNADLQSPFSFSCPMRPNTDGLIGRLRVPSQGGPQKGAPAREQPGA